MIHGQCSQINFSSLTENMSIFNKKYIPFLPHLFYHDFSPFAHKRSKELDWFADPLTNSLLIDDPLKNDISLIAFHNPFLDPYNLCPQLDSNDK